MTAPKKRSTPAPAPQAGFKDGKELEQALEHDAARRAVMSGTCDFHAHPVVPLPPRTVEGIAVPPDPLAALGVMAESRASIEKAAKDAEEQLAAAEAKKVAFRAWNFRAWVAICTLQPLVESAGYTDPREGEKRDLLVAQALDYADRVVKALGSMP